jgi:8-oxo-dGTP diphosphatase
MTNHEIQEAYYREAAARSLPGLSLDCVVFGFHENQLKVLLLRWKDTDAWSLPGGFILKAESIDAAAQRVLRERTGLDELFLQQFHVFGEAVRYDAARNWQRMGLSMKPDGTWPDRTVTVGYYALVEYSQVTPSPDALTDECRWWDLPEVPELLFDHNRIVEVALKTLRTQLSWQPVGYSLLPEKFTMPELQRLYETLLGQKLDPRNFYKKMLGLGILERLDERRTGGAYKSPYLYRFRREAYLSALEAGALGLS